MSAQGNCFILTISDYFTKWVEAVATPDKGALQVASSLFKVSIKIIGYSMLDIHLAIAAILCICSYLCEWGFHGLSQQTKGRSLTMH